MEINEDDFCEIRRQILFALQDFPNNFKLGEKTLNKPFKSLCIGRILRSERFVFLLIEIWNLKMEVASEMYFAAINKVTVDDPLCQASCPP